MISYSEEFYVFSCSVVLKSFYGITKQIGDLSAALKPLYEKYCEPLSDKGKGVAPDQQMRRRLLAHINPYIAPALNEIFKVSSLSSAEAETLKEEKRKGNPRRLEKSEELGSLDFHMSTSAKYLLISAFLASRNPATLDASLFDSKGGSDNRKRKRK